MKNYKTHSIEAAETILKGGVIAYPTESIFGLGCLPLNKPAIDKLLVAKRRPLHKGFILIAAKIDQIKPFIKPLPFLPKERYDQIHESWPGPFTWILPAKTGIPSWLTGNHGTIAVRITDHPIAKDICLKTGSAIVSTSANRHLFKPAKTAYECHKIFGKEIDFIHPGKVGNNIKPSTIIDAVSGKQLR